MVFFMAIIGLFMPEVANIPCTWQNGLELIYNKIGFQKHSLVNNSRNANFCLQLF